MFKYARSFDKTVETPYVTRAMGDEEDEHGRINEVIVDQKAEMILDEWKLHVREVVSDHQQDAKRPAEAHQKPRDQR